MIGRRSVLAFALVACQQGPEPAPPPPPPGPPAPPAPPAPPPPARPIDAAIAAEPPGLRVVVRDSAGDDLPHRRAMLVPLFEHAERCIPRGAPHQEDPPQPSDEIVLGLDAFAEQLVVCAQVDTRRGGSVFSDLVSYACWNVDPASGQLERRKDLARAFFACRDGACPPEATDVASYDGRGLLVYDEASQPVQLFARNADGSRGARVRSFAVPPELRALDPMHGAFVYVGRAIFVRDGAPARTLALDDEGHVHGSVAGDDIRVVDDGHVLVIDHRSHRASLFDLSTFATSRVSLDPALASGPVAFAGHAYALAGRTLVELDPTTFRGRKRLALATCGRR
jgi:hypothetical protein